MFVAFSSIYAINKDVFAMIAILVLFLTLAELIFPSLTLYASGAKFAATLKHRVAQRFRCVLVAAH